MKNKGILYLSGGGNWDKTIKVDTYFLNDLKGKEILFLPIAKETDEKGYGDCCEWLISKFRKIDPLINISVELDFNKVKDLNIFSAVYIGGGNTYKLLDLINKSNFRNLLVSYLNNGGVIFGASAGAVILGKDISTYIEENKEYLNMSNEGLSMVSSYSILCHHIENDNLKAEEYVKRTSNSVISLPIGVALKIEEDCIQIIGDGPVFLFESDGSQSKISGKVSLSNAKKMLQ